MAASFSGTGGPNAPKLPTYAEAASCPTTYPAYIHPGPVIATSVGTDPAIYVVNGRHECVAVVNRGFVEDVQRRRRIRTYVSLVVFLLLTLTISLAIIIPLCRK